MSLQVFYDPLYFQLLINQEQDQENFMIPMFFDLQPETHQYSSFPPCQRKMAAMWMWSNSRLFYKREEGMVVTWQLGEKAAQRDTAIRERFETTACSPFQLSKTENSGDNCQASQCCLPTISTGLFCDPLNILNPSFVGTELGIFNKLSGFVSRVCADKTCILSLNLILAGPRNFCAWT